MTLIPFWQQQAVLGETFARLLHVLLMQYKVHLAQYKSLITFLGGCKSLS